MTRRRKLALVCGLGRPLTEMLLLRASLPQGDAFFFCYDDETTRDLPNAVRVPHRPCNPVSFAVNFVKCWRIVSRERPDFLLSTGPEIAIPWFVVARLRGIPSLYIECGAQTDKPSWTGRVVVHLADRFFVQWPELLDYYGDRAEYRGSLVDIIK